MAGPVTTFDVQAFVAASSSAGSEADELGSTAGGFTPPHRQACGKLLAQAFDITFPKATSDVGDFIQALSDSVRGISDQLEATGTAYQRQEDDAIAEVETIWGPHA